MWLEGRACREVLQLRGDLQQTMLTYRAPPLVAEEIGGDAIQAFAGSFITSPTALRSSCFSYLSLSCICICHPKKTLCSQTEFCFSPSRKVVETGSRPGAS